MQQQPKERRIKGKMDIVLCIDATGSMEPCIEELKNNLKTFIDSFNVPYTSQQVKIDWRARVIYFRDLDVDPEALKEFDFVSSVDELKKQIESIKAEGGGDQPESFLDAIYTAIAKSKWRDGVLHAVIAFTDAPPKSELHHSTVEEGQDRSIATVINAFLMDKYAKLFVYCPMHEIYKELGKIRNSIIKYVGNPGEESVYQGLKNLNFKELLQELGKTLVISSSDVIKM
jgi:hypothetical protein